MFLCVTLVQQLKKKKNPSKSTSLGLLANRSSTCSLTHERHVQSAFFLTPSPVSLCALLPVLCALCVNVMQHSVISISRRGPRRRVALVRLIETCV